MHDIAALCHRIAANVKFSLSEIIITDRLILQRLKYEDAEEIFYTYASKPEATRFVSWETHRRMEDTMRFLRTSRYLWTKQKDFSYSVRLRDTNRLIGGIGCINQEGRIELGYIFSPTQWNKGFATEGCQAVLAELSRQSGIQCISTFVDAENIASIRVLQKCGLSEESRVSSYFPFPNQCGKRKDCVIFSYFPGRN